MAWRTGPASSRHLKLKHVLALLLAACTGAANAGISTRFCDQGQALTATEQDRVLRFAAIVREELADTEGNVALVSRSGLNLARFGIRYSHAALAWRGDAGSWTARQLYYACDESRPRIFDQGIAGFALGTDDPSLGYISLVRLPPAASHVLQDALLDTPRALRVLAGQYSANAYAFGLPYQNCNQWLIEMMAVGWAGMDNSEALRERAQQWLRTEGYAPEPVNVGSRWLMWAAAFVPLIHLDDHPDADRDAMKLQVSLPTSIEAFVRQRLPGSERVEICHDEKQIVVHRGWTPIADGCRPTGSDRVIPL
jgi:hypothetical protein